MNYSALIALIQDLETLLGRRTDVVTFDGLTDAAKVQAIAVEGLVDPFGCVEGLLRQGLQCQELSLATRRTQ